ncbi:hypothetical protein Shyhy01_09650 [Streptomyces hygroscopicus subsp. hygroscopicus]|nr:hypothetical protein Shyhy01_09650 [Streptomyces hygroscopicus subsp. hygroscopicus]
MSSLRVSAPWFDVIRRREFLAPGGFYPGDSGGTAPDSHRLPLLLPYMAWAVHHAPGTAVNLPLTCGSVQIATPRGRRTRRRPPCRTGGGEPWGTAWVAGPEGPRGQDLETIRRMPYATAAAQAAKQT